MTVELKSILFENYKSFQKRQEIEIRPLTILIGKNNAGKSTIARLPLLLSRSLSRFVENPVDLTFEGLNFGDSFFDLVYNRFRLGAIRLGASFLIDNQEFRFSTKIQHFFEFKLQLVTEFEYQYQGQSFHFEWVGNDPIQESNNYRIQELGIDCFVTYQGIFPTKIHPLPDHQTSEIIQNQEHLLSKILLQISEFLEKLTYLGPFREEPKRFYQFTPGSKIQNVGNYGFNAPSLLGNHYFQGKEDILKNVSQWFEKNLGGWSLDLQRHEDSFSFSIVLKNQNSSLEVNLADTGAGISQVLPIVVQRLFEKITGNSQRLEIIEQPELHLHPEAHGAIADLYQLAIQDSLNKFLVETHSENFLLRIRRRIAEGELDSQKVIFYWVDQDDSSFASQIKPIYISPQGEVDHWPQGVFAEEAMEKSKNRLNNFVKNPKLQYGFLFYLTVIALIQNIKKQVYLTK